MNYEYTNSVLDKKLAKLKECNREIELMIESIDNGSFSNESSFYSESSETTSEISVEPRSFADRVPRYYEKRPHKRSACEKDFRSHSALDVECRRDYTADRCFVLKEPQREINKAKITFRMNRPFIPRPPRPVYSSRDLDERHKKNLNSFENSFRKRIQDETAEFVDRCLSAPLRHSYGSSNDLGTSAKKNISRPPISSAEPRYSKPKTASKVVRQSKEKSFKNLNTWVPNGKIKHPIAASLNNLSDLKKQIENEEKLNPKKEKLKQLEQNWKPNGKIREKSTTRESLKESTKDLKEKTPKVKQVENKIKEMEKGWKHSGLTKETPYPKHIEPPLEKEKSTTDLNKKEDTKIKVLEKKWKPSGKVETPFTPFKSIEVKADAESENIDEKKQIEEKKRKELEKKWKPGTNGVKTTPINKAEPIKVIVDKPPPKPINKPKVAKPFAKTFPPAKVYSKPPAGNTGVKDKPSIKKPIKKETVPIKKPITHDDQLNSTPSKPLNTSKNKLIDQSIINASQTENK